SGYPLKRPVRCLRARHERRGSTVNAAPRCLTIVDNFRATPSPGNRVCTVDVDTKVVNCLTAPPPETGSEDRFPVWSPDGSRIALERHSTAGSFIGCAIY